MTIGFSYLSIDAFSIDVKLRILKMYSQNTLASHGIYLTA